MAAVWGTPPCQITLDRPDQPIYDQKDGNHMNHRLRAQGHAKECIILPPQDTLAITHRARIPPQSATCGVSMRCLSNESGSTFRTYVAVHLRRPAGSLLLLQPYEMRLAVIWGWLTMEEMQKRCDVSHSCHHERMDMP